MMLRLPQLILVAVKFVSSYFKLLKFIEDFIVLSLLCNSPREVLAQLGSGFHMVW